MSEPTLIPTLGTWVNGDRFWGRKLELELFEDGLREGNNILLVAQRRMGKTSLMRETMRRLAEDYLCVFIDLEKAASSADAIVELSVALRDHKHVWMKTKELFGNVLAQITGTVESLKLSELSLKLRGGLTAGTWRAKGDELFEILAAADKPVLLFLDEVPILVNRLLKGSDRLITTERREEAEAFMSWLRHNSQKHQERVRIVISGSIGLGPVLRQAKLSATLNTFTPFELRAWDERTAADCLRALGRYKGISYSEGVPEQMIARLGCAIPHHVQMFFGHAYTFCRRRGVASLLSFHVDEVYDDHMLSARGHAELTHYEDRLELVLGKQVLPLALDMLTQTAVAPKQLLTSAAYRAFQADATLYGLEPQELVDAQQEILWVLEHDGYLERTSEGYRFVSQLVRDWWHSRHSFGYTSILERKA